MKKGHFWRESAETLHSLVLRIAGIAISKETFTDAAHEQRNYY